MFANINQVYVREHGMFANMTDLVGVAPSLHLQFPVPKPWASLGGRAIHAAGVLVKIRALFRRLTPKRPLDPGNADAGHPPYAPRSWEATARASGSEIWGCLGTPVPS